MLWIVDDSSEIAGDQGTLRARKEYIVELTKSKVSNWERWGGYFFRCESDDNCRGVFITTHNYRVGLLCSNPEMYDCGLIVVNSCMIDDVGNQVQLYELRQKNKDIRLYYAVQEIVKTESGEKVSMNSIENVGTFGFPTSESERRLFRSRDEGFVKALDKAFVEVKPLLTLGMWGGAA